MNWREIGDLAWTISIFWRWGLYWLRTVSLGKRIVVTTSSMILYFGSVVCWVLVMACLALSSWWYHYPAFCLYSWSFCGVMIFFDIVDTSRLEVLRSFFLLVYQTSVLFVSCLVLSCLVLSCLILCSVLSCLVSCVFNILVYDCGRQYTCVVIPPAPLITSAGFYRGNEE